MKLPEAAGQGKLTFSVSLAQPHLGEVSCSQFLREQQNPGWSKNLLFAGKENQSQILPIMFRLIFFLCRKEEEMNNEVSKFTWETKTKKKEGKRVSYSRKNMGISRDLLACVAGVRWVVGGWWGN